MNSEVDRQGVSPFSIPDIRRFIAFRVLFNSRFYYPVFTILFLDFGLTVAQFSILNAVWAATIVLLEVPSGALADVIGRKRLVVFASAVMVVEVGIISFVPVMEPNVIFIVFLVNRILSGFAEAAASGSDEALAYDALTEQGNANDWGRVLDYMTRFQSMGFILAMSLGAAVYDPGLVQGVCDFAGLDLVISQSMTMRFPLYLTFVLGLACLFVTLGMTGDDRGDGESDHGEDTGDDSLVEAFRVTMDGGRWIVNTWFVFWVMLFGMLFDGVIRMVVTLSSEYYRLVSVPESLFGIIGSAVAILGIFIPRLALRIVETRPPRDALLLTALLAFVGLMGMSFFWPWFGVLAAVITSSAMYFNGFFVSYYLNRNTASKNRATVLSFKGLIYNISYGMMGVVYALAFKAQRLSLDTPSQGGVDSAKIEHQVFMDVFIWFPLVLMAGLVIMGLVSRSSFKKKGLDNNLGQL